MFTISEMSLNKATFITRYHTAIHYELTSARHHPMKYLRSKIVFHCEKASPSLRLNIHASFCMIMAHTVMHFTPSHKIYILGMKRGRCILEVYARRMCIQTTHFLKSITNHIRGNISKASISTRGLEKKSETWTTWIQCSASTRT